MFLSCVFKCCVFHQPAICGATLCVSPFSCGLWQQVFHNVFCWRGEVSPQCFAMFCNASNVYFPSLKVLSTAMVHWVALVAMKWRSNMPEGFRPASHPSPVRGNLSAPLSTSNSTSPPLPSVQMSPVRGNLSLCKAPASPSQHLSPKNLPPVFKNHLWRKIPLFLEPETSTLPNSILNFGNNAPRVKMFPVK